MGFIIVSPTKCLLIVHVFLEGGRKVRERGVKGVSIVVWILLFCRAEYKGSKGGICLC